MEEKRSLPDVVTPPDAVRDRSAPSVDDGSSNGINDLARKSDLAITLESNRSEGQGLIGQTIKNRYTLWEMIGQGIQASAYLAYDNLLEGKVVVKVLSNEVEGIPIPLPEAWEQEAKKAMVVRNCPFIASVTDVGLETITRKATEGESDEEIAFIVWEYVKGETLEDMVSNESELTLEFLLEISQQLIQVLIIFHANNLTHGDLHSKNVMVDRESSGKPWIKVIDFGLSHDSETKKKAFRDLKSMQRMLTHLVEQRREQMGEVRLSGRDQELAAIIEQFGIETDESIEEVLRRTESALTSLARRHLATGVADGEFETLDELFPWSNTVLTNIPINRKVPLIGRTEAKKQLVGYLEHASAEGHGTVLVLRGDGGAGKKRLAWEALHEFCLTRRDLFLMQARGTRTNAATPFAAVREMLREFLGEERESDYPKLLSMLLPESQPLINPLTEFLQDEKPGTAKGTDLPSASVAHLIAKALAKISLLRPTVIWASNLQFLDEPSRKCLMELANHAQRFPLTIMATYTPGEVATSNEDALFSNWYTQFANSPTFLEVPVKGLSKPLVAQFLAEALSASDFTEDTPLVDALWQHSGGNLHFLQESLSYLMQSEIVRQKADGSWQVDENALNEVGAESIQLLLERRVNQLETSHRELLEQTACWGSEFAPSQLVQTYGHDERAAEAILRSLLQQGFFTEVKHDRWAFQPFALWELIDTKLPQDRRQRFHLRVAQTLQEQETLEDNHEATLTVAKHFESGGDPRQALEYCILAAERALLSRANESALEACRRATQLLQSDAVLNLESPLYAAKIHLLQAKAYRYLGDQAAQEEQAYKAYEMAVVARESLLELRALKALGEYHRSISEYHESTDYFRQGMEIAEDMGDRHRIARFLKEIGVNHYLQGDLQQAVDDYQQAVTINQEIGDAEGLARVYNNLGIISRNRGEWKEAKNWFEQSIKYFQESGDTRGMVLPMGNMAIIYTEEGEYEKAMILLKELVKEEKELGESKLEAKVRVTLGDVQFEIGQYREALDNYEQSLTVYRALGDRQGECEVLTNIASVYYEQNKLDLAERFHTMAMELKKEIGYEWGIAYDHYDLARVSIERGDYASALDQISIGKNIARKLEMNEMEFAFEVLECKATEVKDGQPTKEVAKRYDNLCEIYPEVRASMSKQRQLLFLFYASRFYLAYGEVPTGEALLEEARDLIRKLERKIFRREHKIKFRAKYQRLMPELFEV